MSTVKPSSPERPEWVQGTPSKAQLQKLQQSGRDTPSQSSETEVEVAERRAAFQNKFADKKVIVGYNGEHAMMLPFVPHPGKGNNSSVTEGTKPHTQPTLDSRARKLLGPARPVKDQGKKQAHGKSSPSRSNNNDGDGTLASTYPSNPELTSASHTPNPKISTQKPPGYASPTKSQSSPSPNQQGRTPSKSPNKFVAPPPKETLRRYKELQETLATTSKTGGLGANITDETVEKRKAAIKRNEYGKGAAATTLGIGSDERISKAKEQLEKERRERVAAQKAARKEHDDYLLLVDKLRHKGENNYQPSTHVIGGGSGSGSTSPTSQSRKDNKDYHFSDHHSPKANSNSNSLSNSTVGQSPKHSPTEVTKAPTATSPTAEPSPQQPALVPAAKPAAIIQPQPPVNEVVGSALVEKESTIKGIVEYPSDLIDLFGAANRDTAIATFEAQRAAIEKVNTNVYSNTSTPFTAPTGSSFNHPLGRANLLAESAAAAYAVKVAGISKESASATEHVAITNKDIRTAQDLQAAKLQALAHAYLPPFVAASPTLAISDSDSVMMRAHKLDLFKRLLGELGGCDLAQYGMAHSPVDPLRFSEDAEKGSGQFGDISNIMYPVTVTQTPPPQPQPKSTSFAPLPQVTPKAGSSSVPVEANASNLMYMQGLGTVASSYAATSTDGSPNGSKAGSIFSNGTNSPKGNPQQQQQHAVVAVAAQRSLPEAAKNEQLERLRKSHEENQRRVMLLEKQLQSLQ
eukprot:GILI01013348.1.p1 GENE.GILI01013348.1~~GILI01013348.1.p1  ORF type:complete len:745 (+),score=178.06 GILI01013348.1:53-2287(+)